jgi:hypothetical protein
MFILLGNECLPGMKDGMDQPNVSHAIQIIKEAEGYENLSCSSCHPVIFFFLS